MRLATKEQAEAFVFFMESEKLRHHKDIRQIDSTVQKVCQCFSIPKPVLDPGKDYWVEVDTEDVPSVLVKQPTVFSRPYPRNPIIADEG